MVSGDTVLSLVILFSCLDQSSSGVSKLFAGGLHLSDTVSWTGRNFFNLFNLFNWKLNKFVKFDQVSKLNKFTSFS